MSTIITRPKIGFHSLLVLLLVAVFCSCQKEMSFETSNSGGSGGVSGGSAVFALVPSGASCSDAVVSGAYQAGTALGTAAAGPGHGHGHPRRRRPARRARQRPRVRDVLDLLRVWRGRRLFPCEQRPHRAREAQPAGDPQPPAVQPVPQEPEAQTVGRRDGRHRASPWPRDAIRAERGRAGFARGNDGHRYRWSWRPDLQ